MLHLTPTGVCRLLPFSPGAPRAGGRVGQGVEVDGEHALVGAAAVDGEDDEVSRLRVERRGGEQLVDGAVGRGLHHVGDDRRSQDGAGGIPRRQGERVEDRLSPGRSTRPGRDRGDDVGELRLARHRDPVGVLHEGDEQAADHDRVGDGVDVLDELGRLADLQGALAVEALLEPHVPLVEGDADPLVRPLDGGDVVGGGHDRADEAVHVLRAGQEGVEITVDGLVVGVRRDVLDEVEAAVEHDPFPGREGRHRPVRGAAGDELEGLVEALHRAGGLFGQTGILLGRLVPHLPRSVHLVAEAPDPHVVGVGVAVLRPPVRELDAGLGVAVLQQLDRLGDAPGPEVDGEHRLDAEPRRPRQEVIGADLVGLDGPPREVESRGPVLLGADPVLPPVVGDEVATGVAHDRGSELTHELSHVGAEAVLVGGRVIRLVDAGVDAAAHVLDEGPEDPAVERPHRERGIEPHGRHTHWSSLT